MSAIGNLQDLTVSAKRIEITVPKAADEEQIAFDPGERALKQTPKRYGS